MVSEDVKRYRAAWDKENTVRTSIKFNKHTDADIIEKIQRVPSVSGYIKALIRADIKRGEE